MIWDAIVVGGGLAGMSAAMSLADAGASVLLLEQRGTLGGRAGSFHSSRFPQRLLDNCQHVLLGCCHEFQAFYARMGVLDQIRFQDQLVFADTAGRRATMKASCLPSPLHLGPSMMGFSLLSLAARCQIVQAMMAMRSIGREGRSRFADASFAQVLAEMGQSPATIAAFWDVICVSALNEPCATAAAHYGLQVFQEAFLGERGDYRLGFARVPLSRLYDSLAVPVRLGLTVQTLITQASRVCGVRMQGEEIRARQVILATGPWAALSLLSPEMMQNDPQFSRLGRLEYRPIVGAHLLMDRPMLDTANLAMMGTRLHWAFADLDDPRLIHGVASAADDLSGLSQQAIAELFVTELRQACPRAREAQLQQSVIVKEKRATFRPVPGVDGFRPRQRTLIPGLTLAGDYTQTQWPSTMEGAVRSGRLAAEAALS